MRLLRQICVVSQLHMDFSFSSSPAWLLLIVPLAGLAAWFMYRRTSGILSQPVRWLLTGFRFVVLSLLGLLLLEPLLSTLSKLRYPPVVAVIQDNSESLRVHRDSNFVKKDFPNLLKSFLADWNEDDYDLHGHTFSRDIKDGLSPDSLRFNGEGTDIASALQNVHERYRNQNLGAMVLISDGISTSGSNPLYVVDKIRQPVFTILLGDTTPQRDVRIRDLLFNELAYLNTETPIKVLVEADGYDNIPVTVTLSAGGKQVGAKQLTLSNNANKAEADFLFTPEKTGLLELVATVSRLDGEVTYRNNQQRVYINVLESRVKIGLFAGGPHPDLGALKDAFRREKSFEVLDYTLKGTGIYYEDPAKINFADIDLFILHNYPQSSADAAMVRKIAEEIEKRNIPAIYLVGTFTNLTTMQPLYNYMAVSPKSFNPRSTEVLLNFKETYTRHATYLFPPDWISWANNAPPVFRNNSTWEAKANAEVLAMAKIKNVAVDYPVYALQEQLGRKNMVFLGENFWRMRAHSYLEKESFDYFDDWIFSNIKWLMSRSDKRRFKVTTSKQSYAGDEPVFFRGEAYTESYDPMPGVEIKLTVTDPNNKQTDYYLTETGRAQYSLELANLDEGSYSFKAEGRKDGKLLGTDEGAFSIGRSNIEHLRLQADKDLLQQIAMRTGGKFFMARNLAEARKAIETLELKPVADFRRDRRDFHRFGWVMALILTLLSVEWIVRKLNSLV